MKDQLVLTTKELRRVVELLKNITQKQGQIIGSQREKLDVLELENQALVDELKKYKEVK